MNLFSLLLISGGLFANSFLVINGYSYHHNVTKYDYCDNDCNSNNWGIGYETHNETGLIYSAGTFMDSWNKFSWYVGMGGTYNTTKFIKLGFSLGIMNKNYSPYKQITTPYILPLAVIHITDYIIINTIIIPTSNIFGDWSANHEWPTTLFFQYKVRITE